MTTVWLLMNSIDSVLEPIQVIMENIVNNKHFSMVIKLKKGVKTFKLRKCKRVFFIELPKTLMMLS